MKQNNLLTRMLLLFALIVGSTQLWAVDVEVTFDFTTSQTSPKVIDGVTFSWSSTNIVTGANTATSNGFKSNSSMQVTLPSGATLTKIEKTNGSAWGNGATISVYAGTSSSGTSIASIVTGTNSYTISSNNTGGSFYFANSTTKNAWIKTLKLTYTIDADIEDATWSVSPESISVMATKKATAEISTNYNGTLSVVSDDESVATATIANGVITVTGVAEGTAKLTVSGDATARYNAINKTIDVTVTAHVVTPGSYEITPNNSFYGTNNTYSGNATTNPSSLTGVQDDITITYSKGSQANFYVSATQTRAYNGSTMAFSVPENYYITSIEFTADGTNWSGTPTSDVGVMSDSKHWKGTENEVTITFKGTCRIAAITVTYISSTVSKTVSSLGWATWVASGNVEVPSGVSAYIVTASTTQKATLAELLAIPVGTPVLLQGEGTHNFTVCSEDDLAVNENDPADNLLEVSDEETTSGVYVLANDEEGVGFYKWAGGLLGAGYVYLPAPAGGARSFLSFDFSEDNGTTGIGAVLMNSERVNNEVYNLSGQRVAQPTKGLYIVNGKKVAIK